MHRIVPIAKFGLVVVLLAGPLDGASLAQDPPLEWGKIPREDLSLSGFDADTSAAIVLADYGEAVIDPVNRTLRVRQIRRVRILKESGYSLATVVISYNDALRRNLKVEGQTFAVDGAGKVRRTRLEKRDIFREEGEGGWRTLRFTLPALAPGVVFEYRIEWKSDDPWLVPDWIFQDEVPVRWSEFRLDTPSALVYAITRTGRPVFEIEEEIPVFVPGGERRLSRWAMQDVPAFRREPFMSRIGDPRMKLTLQPAGIHSARTGVTRALTTWTNLAQDLLKSDGFGKQLDARGAVRAKARELAASSDDPLEQLIAIHAFVASSVEWNGTIGPIADRSIEDVLRSGSASVAESALLLTAMLRAAGIETYPLLLSTRVTGPAIEQHPFAARFDYVLAYARVGGRALVLDATDPNRPYDLLPTLALAGRGWLVDPEDPRWISIPSFGTYVRSETITATVTDDGGLHASIEARDEGYRAANMRGELADADPTDVVESEILEGLTGITIQSVEVENADALREPLTTRAEFDIPGWASEVGDLVYINPVITDIWKDNPLKSPDRVFPVDFGYPRLHEYHADFELPQGLVVEEMPVSLTFRPPRGAGVYQRRIAVDSAGVHVDVRIELSKSRFETREYEGLRAFFERVAVTQSEPIVLVRSQDR